MQILSIVAIYFVVWWLCLFVVLPFKVRNQVDEGEWVQGTERGAPALLRLWPKLLITTVLAAVVTALVLWLLSNPVLREYWR
jgi:predicted secreted protein